VTAGESVLSARNARLCSYWIGEIQAEKPDVESERGRGKPDAESEKEGEKPDVESEKARVKTGWQSETPVFATCNSPLATRPKQLWQPGGNPGIWFTD
ncbi:MAG: hypothetical protein ABEN55_02425, partial [Bradymonadaceae bacterium]